MCFFTGVYCRTINCSLDQWTLSSALCTIIIKTNNERKLLQDIDKVSKNHPFNVIIA